ncbi:MAG: tetratricopeptide repeat protein, partial [Gammaproteobacteria bacterium]
MLSYDGNLVKNLRKDVHSPCCRKPAVSSKYTKSQQQLGWIYQNGYGVDKNYTMALEYYKNAASQNDAKAQNSLGLMYENAYGVPKDINIAIEWYKKSANQGYPEAQYNLGYIYECGNGVPEDMVLAAKWYEKAAAQGHADSQYHLGLMYENGDGIPEDMELALKFYEKSAVQGNVDAQYRLGLMYENGYEVPIDTKLAAHWYEKAANQGNIDAQYHLGLMYENGRGVVKNNSLAKILYQRSAAQGNTNAQEILNKGILIHEFNYSFRIDEQIYNNYENIFDLFNYESVTLIVTYIGSINIAEKIVLREEINNPYNDIRQQVMIEFDRKRNYSRYSMSLDNCCRLLLSCVWRPVVDNEHQYKLDLVKSKCSQFWKQKIDEALKKADDLVDKNIEEKFLETEHNRNELLAFQDLSIEQSSVPQ